MLTDKSERKATMVARSGMVSEYLEKKGITAALVSLGLNSMEFSVRTAQDLSGTVEALYEKWEDVETVKLVDGHHGRLILVYFTSPGEFSP